MTFWKDRRVLVTGGAGFIGSHLVERLVNLRARVRVIDNLERGSLANLETVYSSIEFVKGDLRDPDRGRQACSEIDTVFHLASRVGGIRFYIERAGEVLIDNTLIDTNTLRAAQDAGVARYLYASSAHVYPATLQNDPQAPSITEDQAVPANPELSYGWAKLLGEKQIQYTLAQRSKLKAGIARICGCLRATPGLRPSNRFCDSGLHPARPRIPQPKAIQGVGNRRRNPLLLLHQ